MELFMTPGMDYIKAFRKLTPYDVDFMCEKIYLSMEKAVKDKGAARSKGLLPFSLPDYKHMHLQGMRDFLLDMVTAQKTSFDHYVEAMRASSYMGARELSPEEIERHNKMFGNLSDELDEKKDPAASEAQGLKTSGMRKSA